MLPIGRPLHGVLSQHVLYWKGTTEGTFFIYLRKRTMNFSDSDELELAGDLRKALASGQVDSRVVQQVRQAHFIPGAQATL